MSKRTKRNPTSTETPNMAVAPSNGEGAASPDLITKGGAPALPIPVIIENYRIRQALHKTSKSLYLQCLSLTRVFLGFNPSADQKSRKQISVQAAAIVASLEKDVSAPNGLQHVADAVAGSVKHWLNLKADTDRLMKQKEKQLELLADKLPVAEWIKSVNGIGLFSLAAIVAEAARPISDYRTPGCLWKRFGLHNFEGRSMSTWRLKGGLNAEQWTQQGYAPRRLSLMYVVGENFVRKTNSPYRKVYLERKAYETANGAKYAHKRARKYATKRFMRDLWCEWQKSKLHLNSDAVVHTLPLAP